MSRGTVTTAYDRLTAEGFLVTRVGAGTFVCSDVVPHRTRHAPVGDVRPRAVWATLPPPVLDAPPSEFDLSVGGPDTSLFPLAAWRRLVSATLRPSLLAASAYEGQGDEGLRREIARYAGLSRSVVAGPGDVLLTNGAQQALDVVARAVVDPGDVVVVEDPGYTAATRLFASHGARVRGVPVDDEGLVVEELPRTARMVYVTPSHQFPTGAVMSLRRRIALLEWASRRNAVIVEDDYDSEFRFEDRPLAPLQSLDRDGRVVYVGSFSKTLMPSLRVGYLIAPQSLQGTLRQAKLLTDWQGDAVTQGALARFMAEGLLSAHVRRVTRIYAERRAALLRRAGGPAGRRPRGAALSGRPAPVHLLRRPRRGRRGGGPGRRAGRGVARTGVGAVPRHRPAAGSGDGVPSGHRRRRCPKPSADSPRSSRPA